MYNEGISATGSLIDLGVEHKILEKKGAWITYQGELVGQGRDAAKQLLREKPELAAKLDAEIRGKLMKAKVVEVTERQPDADPASAPVLPFEVPGSS
jgi:recombination protein RecA